MYHFLRGKVLEKITDQPGAEKIIIDVNGIGFEVLVSLATVSSLPKKGEEGTVYTTLIHREDHMTLFGFATLHERELFNLLLSVSGIGPKSSLSILGELTVSEICYAILNEDSASLSKAQGVGSKTAHRIVLELKEKISNWKYLTIANSKSKDKTSVDEHDPVNNHSVLKDARLVLESLGYSSKDISDAFSKADEKIKDSESLVYFSLKWLSNTKK